MTSRRQSMLVALAVVPNLLLAGCAGTSETLSSIAIAPSPVGLRVGGTRQLVVTGTYSDGTRAPVTSGLTFSSSVAAVAGVSSSGLVTAVAPGSATVTASASGQTATVTVMVSSGQVPVIASFAASPSTIAPGESSVLSWSVTGATTLSIDQGVGVVTGTTSKSVSPLVTTSYTLTATNASGISTASATVTVGALTQMDLPVTFDSATVAYGLLGFGGAEDSTIVADPAGGTNKVAKVVKSATAETWAGTTLTADGTLGFASKIPFTTAATKMTVRVYSPDAGIKVRLKVEDHTDPTKSVETEATTTVANAWETLTFDFTVPTVPPTAAFDPTKSYDKASIFFNFGVAGSVAGAKTYYFDDVQFGP